MKKRNRTALFFGFVFLFFASIPAIVLYTQGYRIDFENQKLVETSGIDVRIRPYNVKIFLNDNLEQETNFIFRDALFRNIVPGEYTIRLEKEHYQNWDKTLTLEGGQVNKIDYARLFPVQLEERIILDNVKKTELSPDFRFALIEKEIASSIESSKTNAVQKRLARQLNLLELSSGEEKIILHLEPGESVSSLQWADDSETFLVKLMKSKKEEMFTSSINSPSRLFAWSEFISETYPYANTSEKNIIPTNTPNVLFSFQKQRDGLLSLDRLNITERETTFDVVENIITFAIHHDKIFYIDDSFLLKKVNMFTGHMDVLNEMPINSSIEKSATITIQKDEKAAAVIHGGEITLWQEDKPLERISEDADQAKFSQDTYKLVYWNDDEISVHWLEEVFGPPKRDVGDVEILDEFTNIKNVEWFEDRSLHLMVEKENSIIFAELDSRNKRNIIEYDFENDILGFDQKRQFIYVLKDDVLTAYPTQ